MGNVARQIYSYPIVSYFLDVEDTNSVVVELDVVTSFALPTALIHPLISPKEVSLPAYIDPLFVSFNPSGASPRSSGTEAQVYTAGVGSRITVVRMAGPFRLASFLAVGPLFLGGQYFSASYIAEPVHGKEYSSFFVGPFAAGTTVSGASSDGSQDVSVFGVLSRWDLVLPIHLGGFLSGNPGASWIKVLPRLTFDMTNSEPLSFQIGLQLRPSFGNRRARQLESLAGEAEE